MKQIKIADRTLCQNSNALSFREKLEIARFLDKLRVDVIELPEIANVKSDTLLIKTILSFVTKSTVSICAGSSVESIEFAANALEGNKNSQIRIELPMSPVGMEYISHKKSAGMLEWINKAVSMVASKGIKVELCALDATRAEKDFLKEALSTAINSGADMISVCDNAAEMMPDEFADFVGEITADIDAPIGVYCDNKNGLASAEAILAVKNGATYIKTVVGSQTVSLEEFATLIKNCGVKFGVSCNIANTELNRIVKQIYRITNPDKNLHTGSNYSVAEEETVHLDVNDDIETVSAAVAKLGYDLSAEDQNRVYEEFLRVAAKKNVGAKELDAIVASEALQVPATYKLETYAINTGNTASPSAQIVLKNGDKALQGIGIGDGPIDAAFLTLEKILGRHFELDQFQIHAVTEGQEAMGSAIVKLRSSGKIYSGNGISTDILGASIRAYLSAVNKIIYEESQG